MTDADAIRGRLLVEESREAIVVLDDADRVLHASRRARQTVDGVREGERLPSDILTGERGVIPLVVPYDVGDRRERLVYLSREGDLAAYEELRAGFTAAVSHELRTPLARLLTLLETTALPGEDVPALVDQARAEIDQITELIDEVLFLSELESGARVVALGADARAPRPRRGDRGARGARRPGGRRAPARVRSRRRACHPAADAPRDRAEPRRERDPLRRPGRDVHARRRASGGRRSFSAGGTTESASTRPSFHGSSSASTGPIVRGHREERASGSRS